MCLKWILTSQFIAYIWAALQKVMLYYAIRFYMSYSRW